jgi:hypothetical protein
MRDSSSKLRLSLLFLASLSRLSSAAEFPEIQKGMCGPAKVINSYLENAGFFLQFEMVVVAPDGAHMIYLPQPKRVAYLKASGRLSLGIEKVEVLHQDSNAEHPDGWECVTGIYPILETERRALTDYLNAVDRIVK